MGCNNSVGQNSFEIEPFKVGWLESNSEIFPFSLHFFIPSSFKYIYLRAVLTYRDGTHHFGNLRSSILPLSMIRSRKKVSLIQEIGKNKIRKF